MKDKHEESKVVVNFNTILRKVYDTKEDRNFLPDRIVMAQVYKYDNLITLVAGGFSLTDFKYKFIPLSIAIDLSSVLLNNNKIEFLLDNKEVKNRRNGT